MDLQMQLKRALIGLVLWAALGGAALSGGGAENPPQAQGPGAGGAARDDARCNARLRIELTPALRLTLPCGRACVPVRAVAHALSRPVATRSDSCALGRA